MRLISYIKKKQLEKLERRMDVDILNLKKSPDPIGDAFCNAIRAVGYTPNTNADTTETGSSQHNFNNEAFANIFQENTQI